MMTLPESRVRLALGSQPHPSCSTTDSNHGRIPVSSHPFCGFEHMHHSSVRCDL